MLIKFSCKILPFFLLVSFCSSCASLYRSGSRGTAVFRSAPGESQSFERGQTRLSKSSGDSVDFRSAPGRYQSLESKNIDKRAQNSNRAGINKPYTISIEFKGEQVFEKGKTFKNLKVGGLSELFFDKNTGLFLALSDDKTKHRFYKLALSQKPSYSLEIIDQVLLKSPGKQGLTMNMDPEALVLYGNDKIFIASEGQQIYEVHEPTQIFKFDREGILEEAWPVPEVFWKKGRIKEDPLFGHQANKGFESLTLDKKANLLWTATEKPLKQDRLQKETSFVRLSAFDIRSQRLRTQYPYFLKDKEGGLVALELLKPDLFLSLERAYKKQKQNGVNEVSLFLTDCRKAGAIQNHSSKLKRLKACAKEQIWTSTGDFPVKADNLEALALGPMLASDKQLLVLASDNNFNEEKQKNQFLFFELGFAK